WRNRLLFIAAATLACALLNPSGPDVITAALRSINSVVGAETTEWKSAGLGFRVGLSLWILLFILASNLRVRSVSLADKLLAVLWFFAALSSARNYFVWLLLSFPYVAACIAAQTEDLRKEQPASPFGAFLMSQPLKRLWGGCLALTIGFITLV